MNLSSSTIRKELTFLEEVFIFFVFLAEVSKIRRQLMIGVAKKIEIMSQMVKNLSFLVFIFLLV
jgi:hypothetical protein